MSDEIEFEKGSGNVFADLELPDAEEMLLKAHLAHQISVILEERELTQLNEPEAAATRGGDVDARMAGVVHMRSLYSWSLRAWPR